MLRTKLFSYLKTAFFEASECTVPADGEPDFKLGLFAIWRK